MTTFMEIFNSQDTRLLEIYNLLQNRIQSLYDNAKDPLREELENIAFEQGRVAAYRSVLPFADEMQCTFIMELCETIFEKYKG